MIKKVSAYHAGTFRTSATSHLFDFTARDQKISTFLRSPFARCQFHSGNRGDCGKRLTAEAHGADACQTFFIRQFRCCMTQKGNACIFRFHPASVICHPDIGCPSSAYLTDHRMRTCIKGVFHQFFHNGCRPFNDFACSN